MADIFLCHYMEPVTHSMQTVKNCLSLQYVPKLLLHIFVLDDGCTGSVWAVWVANKDFKITVNTNVVVFVVTCVAILRDSCTNVWWGLCKTTKLEDVASPVQFCP